MFYMKQTAKKKYKKEHSIPSQDYSILGHIFHIWTQNTRKLALQAYASTVQQLQGPWLGSSHLLGCEWCRPSEFCTSLLDYKISQRTNIRLVHIKNKKIFLCFSSINIVEISICLVHVKQIGKNQGAKHAKACFWGFFFLINKSLIFILQ